MSSVCDCCKNNNGYQCLYCIYTFCDNCMINEDHNNGSFHCNYCNKNICNSNRTNVNNQCWNCYITILRTDTYKKMIKLFKFL